MNAWKFSFAKNAFGRERPERYAEHKWVYCRIPDLDEAMAGARQIVGEHDPNLPILQEGLSEEALALLGVEPGKCMML